jgi:hypothetical protein
MIPNNAITPTPRVSTFKPPENQAYSATSHVCSGPINISDLSQGREYQYWTTFIDGGKVKMRKTNTSTVAFTYPTTGTIANLITCSGAFDQNGSAIVAFQTAQASNIWFYNSGPAAYQLLSVTGTTSCRIAVDDLRDFNKAGSDIIFAYTDPTGKVYYRQQRENYNTPRFVGTASSSTAIIKKLGMNLQNRLQFFVETTG